MSPLSLPVGSGTSSIHVAVQSCRKGGICMSIGLAMDTVQSAVCRILCALCSVLWLWLCALRSINRPDRSPYPAQREGRAVIMAFAADDLIIGIVEVVLVCSSNY